MSGRAGPRRWERVGAAVAPAVLLFGGACGNSGGEADRASETVMEGVAPPLTVEEAGKLALGHLVRVYGRRADPVPQSVEWGRDRIGGRIAWRLEMRVAVGEGDERHEERWTVWVGVDEGRPAVLDTRGPGR